MQKAIRTFTINKLKNLNGMICECFKEGWSIIPIPPLAKIHQEKNED